MEKKKNKGLIAVIIILFICIIGLSILHFSRQRYYRFK